jgi:hypothetical protein
LLAHVMQIQTAARHVLRRLIEEERMQEAKKVQELAEAASHLCAALDELSVAGYGPWSDEVKKLIDIIAAEIGWLQTQDVTLAGN